MARLLLLNLLLMLLWPALNQDFTTGSLVVGFGLGFAIITLFDRGYGLRIVRTIWFLLYVLWEILASNLVVAGVVVQAVVHRILGRSAEESKLGSGIVGVPLRVRTDLEITLLASVITLTPGTLSMELSPDRRILYIHLLRMGDPDRFIQEIQSGFERRILQITRGEA